VVLTHPAGWGRTRLRLLAEAAERAGLGEVRFVAEPVAAAAYFASVLGRTLPADRVLVVYDLGAGTFDVSVVRPADSGYEVVGTAGLTDVGGLDLDAAVVAHARGLTGHFADAWRRLDAPRTVADQQARYTLWRGARAVKEQLSRHVSADLHVPLAETDVRLNRDEFEKVAEPYLARTVQLTLALLAESRLTAADIAGVFLVGGASRIPLAATLLHRALGFAPTVIDQPELVVAEGSLHPKDASATDPSPRWTAAADAWPSTAGTDNAAVAEPPPGVGFPAPRRRRTATVLTAGAVVAALVAVAAVTLHAGSSSAKRDTPPSASTHSAGPKSPSSSHSSSPSPPAPGRLLSGHTDIVQSVAFSPDGATLATGSNDNTVRLWEVATATATTTLAAHTDSVLGIAFSPDGTLLASASSDRTVRLWAMLNHQTNKILTGHTDAVWCVAFSPDGKTIATGSSDETVRLWSTDTGKTVATLRGHQGSVNGVAFSPDGKTVVSIADDGRAMVWNVATHVRLRTFAGQDQGLHTVAFSHDGTTVATGGESGNTRLWNANTGVLLRTIPAAGKDQAVYGAAFAPDGKTLALGTSDGTATLWDPVTGNLLRTLSGHEKQESVKTVAFSNDGTMLAEGSVDFTARLWHLTG
jgi:hypothetical protein